MSKFRWFRCTTSSRLLWKCLLLLILCPALAALAAAPEDLMLYLPLEDAQNPMDLSDNPTSVVVHGSVTGADGQFGGKALQLDGNNANRLEVVHADKLEGMAAITIEAWVMPYNIATHEGLSIASKRVAYQDGDVYNLFTYSGPVVNARVNGQGGSALISTTELEDDTWYHAAFVFDGTGATGDKVKLYINGVLEVSGDHPDSAVNTGGAPVWVGELDANRGLAWDGILDEIGIWNIPLTQEEINLIMNEGKAKMFRGELAWNPKPVDGEEEVLPATDLNWSPGTYAATHDVYFGTNWEDVNGASLDNPLDVLISQDQDANTFDLDTLRLGETYYWRIDEVNAPPDRTIFKGDIWSFTVEPVSYPLDLGAVSATASSTTEGQDPNNTVNGSGLDENDRHSNDQEDMWLAESDDTTPSIQFALSQVEKLDKIHVWNHNTQTETILGFGIKEALIETSVDGETWTELGTVELAQASGMADYTGTDVSLGGAMAKYVKITALSNYSILGLPQKGLAEVRFYAIPVLASDPIPADGSTSDGVDVTLQWRTGREAVEHEVVFSTDEQAVIDGSAVVATTSESTHDLGTLDLGTAYFWKINEMNDLGTPPAYEGDLWTFLTPDQIMIDDFEMYKAQDGLFIWEHWIDGFDNPAENGAVVGNGDEPETAEVYEGTQSMPLAYNNVTAPKSEATHIFDPPLDLEAGNPESVEVYVKGIPYEFNGYYSVDGSSWTSMSWNPRYLVMSEDAHVGMAVTSHDVALETTAVFTNVTTTGNVSGDWTQADIGGTHPGGNFTEVNGTFTIEAMGADIWTTDDEFRYVYKNLDGAGAITAQVQNLDPVNGWTKVGVMIRDTTETNSSNGGVYATGTNGVRYQARLETGVDAVADDSVLDGTQEIMSPPVWVRMERKLANGAAPIYMTLTDRSGKSATIETEATDATTVGTWTRLSAAPANLNVDLSQIESITIGVNGSNVEGTIFVDAIRTARPYPAATE